MSGVRLSRDLVGGAVFLAGGIVAIWSAADLSMGTLRLVGPGAFPILLGVALVLLATALIVQSLRTTAAPRTDEEAPEPFGHARVALVAALIAVFIAILPLAGFVVASAALMVALYAIGARQPFSLFPLVAGLLTSLVAYLLFVLALGVPLPMGIFWGS